MVPVVVDALMQQYAKSVLLDTTYILQLFISQEQGRISSRRLYTPAIITILHSKMLQLTIIMIIVVTFCCAMEKYYCNNDNNDDNGLNSRVTYLD